VLGFSEEELVDVLETLSSDFFELSDSDSDSSDVCDISTNEPPAAVHKRKRSRSDDFLLQWSDSDFRPTVQFNSDDSGIS
jgi:hypothetical protein